MDKIILRKDVILNKVDKTAGLTGILIVQQDSTGNHLLSLGEGNAGAISVSFEPNSVTQLAYLNSDDGKTYWTSTVLSTDPVINSPETIVDLTWEYVDTIGVKINWTAPNGLPPNPSTHVDRYNIYVSQAEITPSTNLNGLAKYEHSIVPSVAGITETLVLNQLLPNKTYYVAIVSDKVNNGKNFQSGISNIIHFTTLKVDNTGGTEEQSTRVPIKDIYSVRGTYKFVADNFLDTLNETYIVDYNNIIDIDGIPSGTPSRNMAMDMYGKYYPDWYHENFNQVMIELDGAYNLDYFYILMPTNMNNPFHILTSTNGKDYSLAHASTGSDFTKGVWSKLSIQSNAKALVTNIQFRFFQQAQTLQGFIIYGKRNEKLQIKGIKFKRTVPSREFIKSFGTNSFLDEQFPMMSKVSSFTRFYNEWEWFLGDGYGDASDTLDKTLSNIPYRFNTSYMWNYDSKFQALKDLGIDVLFCASHTPKYLSAASATNTRNVKPIDPLLEQEDLTITTNPQSYKHYGRGGYNIAARYGSNPDVDETYIQLPDGEPLEKGLNMFQYMEFGNEQDQYWQGDKGYNTPFEMAARTSAVADGHKGALGAGIGVKAADPNMKIVMGGLAGPLIGYLREMLKFWDATRGKGDYPIDAINFHLYNIWKSQPNVQTYEFTAEQYALNPEDGELRPAIKEWSAFRDEFLPTKELFITEIGYDEHLNGMISPNYENQEVRSKYKAYWLLRTFLICRADGVDVINQYWYANTGVRLEDYTGSQREKFMTCGYVDGIISASDKNRKPLTSYWFVSAFRNELEGYKLSHWIKDAGVSKFTGNILQEADPRLFAVGFTNTTTLENCVVAWLGTVGFQSLTTKVYVDISENNIDVVYLDQANITQDEQGVTETLPVITDGTGRYINVTLTECPVIIKTKNIGTPMLVKPENVQIQSLTATSIKLTWKDRNIGTNNTKVFQSNHTSDNFTLIYNNYIDNGELAVADLEEGTTYYFRIQFVDGDRASETSTSIGITTSITVPPVSNLTTIAKSPTSITLGWDFLSLVEISGFEIYRSLTSTGEYTLLATVGASVRDYKNLGLSEETNYYYKVRTLKGFDVSVFSMVWTATTDPITLEPPTITKVISDYNGGLLTVNFSLPIKDLLGSENAFQLIENPSAPILHNIIASELKENDSQIAYLTLDTNITSNLNELKLSYSSSDGFVKSTYDVLLGDAYDIDVTNNFESAALVSNIYKLNITDKTSGNVSPVDSGWYDVNFLDLKVSGSTIEQPYTSLLNTDGENNGVKLLAPYKYRDWNLAENATSGASSTPIIYPSSPNILPIESVFPRYAIGRGVRLAYRGTYNWTCLSFLNLDTTKVYNVKAHVTRRYDQPGEIEFANFDTPTEITTMTVGHLNEKPVVLSNLKASVHNISYEASAIGEVPPVLNPSIVVLIRGKVTATNFALTSLILEEINEIDNSAEPVVPVITLAAIGNVDITNDNDTLSVSSTNPVTPITLISDNTNVVTVTKVGSDWKLGVIGTGTTSVNAFQSAGNGFATAVPVSQSVTVSKINSALTFPDLDNVIIGDEFEIPVSSTNPDTDIIIASSDESIISVSNVDGVWSGHALTGGTVTLTASQLASAFYNAPDPISQSVTVGSGADVIAPTVPTGLTATLVSYSGFTASWSPSTDNVGVTGYNVDIDGTVLSLTGTSITRTGLTASTAYIVKVRASDLAGNLSAYCDPITITTSGAPVTPTLVFRETFTNTGATAVRLNTINWDFAYNPSGQTQFHNTLSQLDGRGSNVPVNAGYTIESPKGVLSSGTANTRIFFYTSKYTINRTSQQLYKASWYMGNQTNSPQNQVLFAVKVGSNWYAYDEGKAMTTGLSTPNEFAASAEFKEVVFDMSSAKWKAIAFTVNTVLSLDSTLINLPSGDVTGFGWYCYPPSGSSTSAAYRLDTLEIYTVPV